MEVEVIRSARRRKTVSAREVDGVIRVSIPARMSKADERRHVAQLVARLERRKASAEIDLAHRATLLAARFGLPRPASVRWVDNQDRRWGSCTIADRTIRLSSRLARYPLWVVDYVLVHELAHLAESGHTRRFWALVDRYPKAERARGYLIAKGVESDDSDTDANDTDAGVGVADVAGSEEAAARG
jgi:predicted metal-dependent hydrolase